MNHELVYSLRKASLTVRGLSLTDIYPSPYKWFYVHCSLLSLITVLLGGGAKQNECEKSLPSWLTRGPQAGLDE